MHSWPLLPGLSCILASPIELAAQYVMDGIVRDSATGAPLSNVEITVQGQGRAGSVCTTPSGRFRIIGLLAGPVDMRVRRIGYHPREIGTHLPLSAPLDVTLASPNVIPNVVPLEDLVARPERRGDVTAALDHVITRDEIATLTFLGEDAYRTLTRTPGVTADEMSARFRMRGAEQEEVLVRLDGMTLVDPFHLNDLSGTLSIVDGHWIERATVSAAGFGAQYGDRTGGVVEFVTPEPSAMGHRLFLSASLTHLRIASEGVWGGGRGGWIVSARRGVPDLMLSALGRASSFSAGYSDGMAKLTLSPTPNHTLFAHLLTGADRFDARLDLGQTLSRSRSRRVYSWLQWQAGWSATLRTETVLALTGISPHREVDFYPQYLDGVSDRRRLRQLSLRHEVEWTVGRAFGGRAGVEIQRGQSRYDYAFRAPIVILTSLQAAEAYADTGTTRIARDGTTVAAYLSSRVRFWNRVDVETGLRYDHASHAGVPRVEPRVRGRLALTDEVVLFGSWGRYSQAKGLQALDVVEGERIWTVQRATQTTTGLEWRLGGGVRVQAEGYRRTVTQPWTRHVNIELGFAIIPESGDNTLYVVPVRSRAEGIELEVEGPLGPRFRWHAGYSLSRVEDLLEATWVPRTYDQRHAAALDGAWHLGRRWSVSAAWQAHSGWPITEPDFVRYTIRGGHVLPRYDYLRLGESRLPVYHRLDLRLRHDRRVAGSTLGISLDLVNVLNRRNVRGMSYTGIVDPQGIITAQRTALSMAPFAPMVMVSWGH
jgi:hypothetical protein